MEDVAKRLNDIIGGIDADSDRSDWLVGRRSGGVRCR